MNEHIYNGNKILGTAERTSTPVSIGVVGDTHTHFHGDDETIARARKEYSRALNDELSETERRIVENRLDELESGLVNLWIAEHYGEKKTAPG